MSPVAVDIRPTPTEEEAAAIVAAIELAWPRPSGGGAEEIQPRWRFSGRWWNRPVPTRRERP